MLLPHALTLLLVSLTTTTLASPIQQLLQGDPRARTGDNAAGWSDPRVNGGSMLDRATEWNNLGEPLNLIISGRSSPDVLRHSGMLAYIRSLGFYNECANQHIGDHQYANLGDGAGWQPELSVMRESWFPYVGACLESVLGGNHFRIWQQGNTSAWFLAASKEVDVRGNHKITHNGYNLGRDLIVEKAIQGTSYRGRSWTTTVEWVEGLLSPGRDGINHNIAQDGKVAVLTAIEF